MDDEGIIQLYFSRDESAITESQKKFGAYLLSIAYRILNNNEDASECENDTYLTAWNTIPPKKPNPLSGYLVVVCRSRSLDKWRKLNAQKRGCCEVSLSLSELEECVPADKRVDDELEEKELAGFISAFLRKLPESECNIFIYRYWHLASIKEISDKYVISESKVKITLYRTRVKLKAFLQKEGIFV